MCPMITRIGLCKLIFLIEAWPRIVLGEEVYYAPIIIENVDIPNDETIDVVAAIVGIDAASLRNWLESQHLTGTHTFCGLHMYHPDEAVSKLKNELYHSKVQKQHLLELGLISDEYATDAGYLWRAFLIGRILSDPDRTGCPDDFSIFDDISRPERMSLLTKAQTFTMVVPRCPYLWAHYLFLANDFGIPVSTLVEEVALLAFYVDDPWISNILNTHVISWFRYELEHADEDVDLSRTMNNQSHYEINIYPNE